nr:hypothetical protein [Tanacetum cinerariifolium]
KVLDLEDELKRTKTAQQTKIDGLERRVKKLEKKQRSRTHKLKRLYKERIDEIDADEDIALVSTHGDVSNQDNIVQDEGIQDVGEEEVVEVVTNAKMLIDIVVDVTQVTTVIADILVSVAETIVTTAPTVQEKGKGKAKLIEEPEMPKTRKHQITVDKELAKKLQAKMQAEINEENMIAREKSQQSEEVNIAWDDVQAKIDADYELAQRLQAEEQDALTDAEKATILIEFLEKRRMFFAAKRAEEKRNRPPTKAQQRCLISKREGDELEQERSKKQKVEDNQESEELKKCLEIIPDDGDDVTINATPFSSKSPIIADYKIYKEGKKTYF